MEFIDNTLIEDFSTEGAVLCKGIFLDWLDPLRIGVDKIVVNSAAVKNPNFINKLSKKFGSQSVVVNIEVKK